MAQSAEHILGKDEVPGSNPGISSRQKAPLHLFAVGRFYVLKIGSLSSQPILEVLKTEKLRQRVLNNNPLIIFETAKQSVKITVIFIPELCKMVRHKLISCSFELRITYTLLRNYAVARCFCIGATLWRSFLCDAVFFCWDCGSTLLCTVKIMRGVFAE